MKLYSIALPILALIFLASSSSCDNRTEADKATSAAQERILDDATKAVGIPAIKNYREKRFLKDIYELRDQEGIVTYTYIENMTPVPIAGKTALGGKFTFLGESVGYGIPYATQFSNPERPLNAGYADTAMVPQAEPNALFMPTSAEATWVILKNPGSNQSGVVYIEPKIAVFPFRLPVD